MPDELGSAERPHQLQNVWMQNRFVHLLQNLRCQSQNQIARIVQINNAVPGAVDENKLQLKVIAQTVVQNNCL